MDSKVEIELGFNWKVGRVNLNELVYRVDEQVPALVCQILEKLIERYQQIVVERLSRPHSSTERAGLGRHRRKGGACRFCAGRRVVKRGYRRSPRCINSKYGRLMVRLQEVECVLCGARFPPLPDAFDWALTMVRHKHSAFLQKLVWEEAWSTVWINNTRYDSATV